MVEWAADPAGGRDGDLQPWELANERPRVATPWPDFDNLVTLYRGKLLGLGAFKGRREAAAGLELAVHAAANGHSAVLFAPELPRRNPVPRLLVDRSPELTPSRLRGVLDGMAGRGEPAELVVIDHFGLLQPDQRLTSYDDYGDYERWDEEDGVDKAEQAAGEVARELKHLAMDHEVPIVVMAYFTGTFDKNLPLDLDRLGNAAVLEYDADAVLLLRRLNATQVFVRVAKDRSGPAPADAVVGW
ncbi:DnaB-like helicase C-terminal domain-containing protein [Kitasatospora sp. NPDC051853]|uniref:DnaB-like helicase C-terminal domain-containing protein n=1 Tax=Kitasatospora sp. NPDC051853 TaxID=3364058 RepID=UPI0037A41BF1